ncbi:MFS transporter [bacterium]|nr:MFS transporter [bacterium]
MDELDRSSSQGDSSPSGETIEIVAGSSSASTSNSAAPPRPSRLVRWYPALRFRYFRWYLAGHLLSVIGGWMQDAGLKWYVQTLTKEIGSEFWLGLTTAMASVPILIFSPIGGALADRWSRRLVLPERKRREW